MSRRIDIELTSAREDGSWTWRAAGAREPKGTLDGGILPPGATTGQVLRVEVEGHLDGIEVVNVLPPRTPRTEPERLELKTPSAEQPLVTSTLAAKRSGERGRRRGDRDRDERGGTTRTRERRGERDGGRDRQDRRHERSTRPAPPPVEQKPKPKRLRPGKTHRTALLESVPAEQRPIAEQLLAGGLPAVRQAIEKQNAELKAEGKPEVKPDALLRVAEDLRNKAAAAVWRDRAEAAVTVVDELDLRDLRSVVNAAGDAGRDDDARALAAQLREALANRVEKEHAAWLAELAETVRAGRVVRALRLSSRPPKAGAPIPGDVSTELAEATAASLTSETGPDRWATVLDALAYSPVRRRVVPQSLPEKLTPDLRATIARLASRLPEIGHIFDIEPDPAAERAARARRRPAGGRSGPGDRPRGAKGADRGRGKAPRGDRPAKGARAGDDAATATPGAPAADQTAQAEAPSPTTGDAAPPAPSAATSGEATASPTAAAPEAPSRQATASEDATSTTPHDTATSDDTTPAPADAENASPPAEAENTEPTAEAPADAQNPSPAADADNTPATPEATSDAAADGEITPAPADVAADGEITPAPAEAPADGEITPAPAEAPADGEITPATAEARADAPAGDTPTRVDTEAPAEADSTSA